MGFAYQLGPILSVIRVTDEERSQKGVLSMSDIGSYHWTYSLRRNALLVLREHVIKKRADLIALHNEFAVFFETEIFVYHNVDQSFEDRYVDQCFQRFVRPMQ